MRVIDGNDRLLCECWVIIGLVLVYVCSGMDTSSSTSLTSWVVYLCGEGQVVLQLALCSISWRPLVTNFGGSHLTLSNCDQVPQLWPLHIQAKYSGNMFNVFALFIMGISEVAIIPQRGLYSPFAIKAKTAFSSVSNSKLLFWGLKKKIIIKKNWTKLVLPPAIKWRKLPASFSSFTSYKLSSNPLKKNLRNLPTAPTGHRAYF